MSTFKAIVQLLRPKQWIKNAFVAAPLIFSEKFLNTIHVIHIIEAIVLFCIASSAAYIVNDIVDVGQDKLHPQKSHKRPLAAGLLTSRQAMFVLYFLYALLIMGFFILPSVFLVIVVYLLLNYLYTFALKNYPVIDIFIVSSGFVLRIYAGALALLVPLSPWMFITTLSLSLFLSSIKRQQEIKSNMNGDTRIVLRHYNVTVVTKFAEFSAILSLVFYSIFVLFSNQLLVWSVPLVMYGIFRYWYLMEMREQGESPTDLIYSDWQMVVVVLLWILSVIYALWPH